MVDDFTTIVMHIMNVCILICWWLQCMNLLDAQGRGLNAIWFNPRLD